MNKIQLVQHYLHYYFTSETKFDVHSPFVFSFITEVLEDNKKYDEYERLIQISKISRKNYSQIKKNDLGAGSKIATGDIQTVGKLFQNTSLHIMYAKLLFRVCNYYNPQTIVELGTGFGTSTLSMALAQNKPKIYTIEGNSAIAAIAESNFNELNLNNIKLITGNFDSLLPELLKGINQVDLAFIDGNHQKQKTVEYYQSISYKCGNDSIIIFDDIRWSEEMFEAWNKIIADEKVTLSLDLFRIGIVFFRKEQRVKEHFVLKF